MPGISKIYNTDTEETLAADRWILNNRIFSYNNNNSNNNDDDVYNIVSSRARVPVTSLVPPRRRIHLQFPDSSAYTAVITRIGGGFTRNIIFCARHPRYPNSGFAVRLLYGIYMGPECRLYASFPPRRNALNWIFGSVVLSPPARPPLAPPPQSRPTLPDFQGNAYRRYRHVGPALRPGVRPAG